MDDRWVVVTNWEKFQHYGDRHAPWIKNYTDLLHRDEYLSLAPTARALLHGLWLLYAPNANQIRTGSVRGALQMRAKREHWESLVQAGFIELSASKPRARVRPRPGEEVEVEKNHPPQPPRRADGSSVGVVDSLDLEKILYSMDDA